MTMTMAMTIATTVTVTIKIIIITIIIIIIIIISQAISELQSYRTPSSLELLTYLGRPYPSLK